MSPVLCSGNFFSAVLAAVQAEKRLAPDSSGLPVEVPMQIPHCQGDNMCHWIPNLKKHNEGLQYALWPIDLFYRQATTVSSRFGGDGPASRGSSSPRAQDQIGEH